MESIFTLILIVIGISVVRWLISAAFKTVGAAGKAAMGNGSFSENMDLSFKGMGSFETRLTDSNSNEDGSGFPIKEIEGKGLLSLSQTKNVGFITSVIDVTDGGDDPVISVLEGFQEENSVAYQQATNVGRIEPDQGFIKWVRLGVIIPEILEPPYSGSRDLAVIVRMVDMDNIPEITYGFGDHENDPGILWQQSHRFVHLFEEKGYKEASEHRDESLGIALQIGMAVAMSDGVLDDTEGEVLKKWIIKNIAPFSEEKQNTLKQVLNQKLRDSYTESQNGTLSLSNLTMRLNDIGDKTTKYEAIELCFEVMAADGVADEDELKTINKVAEALNLDMNEIVKMRDQEIINLDTNVSEHAGIEVLLGIDPEWSHEQIKKHLRTEFQKWNNRLNTLSEGEERDNAQLMLNKIAEARKQYA